MNLNFLSYLCGILRPISLDNINFEKTSIPPYYVIDCTYCSGIPFEFSLHILLWHLNSNVRRSTASLQAEYKNNIKLWIVLIGMN